MIGAAEVFQRVVEAKGCLLRVTREPLPGGGEQLARAFVLVFDVATLAIRCEAGELAVEAIEPGPARGVSADQDDPWWSILGNRPAKALAREGGALLVQFREDRESPKLLLFSPRGAAVAVRSVI